MRAVSLVLFVTALRLVDSKCWSHYSRFTSCLPDLSGYKICDHGKESEVLCTGNTRCSCFLGNDCDIVQPNGYGGDWGVKEENICQVLPEPFPMKEVLHLTFKKGGWEWRYEDDYRYFDQEGEVKQNLKQQKLAYRWGVPEHRHFKIVIPDDNGEFIRFYGKYNPNRCRRVKVKEFPQFAGEIKYWRLKHSTKIKNGNEKQMWYNQIFRYEGNNGLTKRWTVISDPVKKHVVPLRYHDTYTGTQEEQCCDHAVHIDYKEVEVPPNTNTDEWFQIPDFCP